MNTVQVEDKQQTRRDIVRALYKHMTPGVERRQMSSDRFAQDAGLSFSTNQMKNRLSELESLGILRRRMEMGSPDNGMTFGRHYHWTLLVDEPEANSILDRADAEEISGYKSRFSEGSRRGAIKRAAKRSGGGMPYVDVAPFVANPLSATPVEAPAFTVRDGVAVEAIIGPEPEGSMKSAVREVRKMIARSNLGESTALVEAARSYRDRHHTVDAKFAELVENAKAVGISIDMEAMLGALKYDRDERLENVALALPYIDHLQSSVERLTDECNRLRSVESEAVKLRQSNSQLKSQVERLISESVK